MQGFGALGFDQYKGKQSVVRDRGHRLSFLFPFTFKLIKSVYSQWEDMPRGQKLVLDKLGRILPWVRGIPKGVCK